MVKIQVRVLIDVTPADTAGHTFTTGIVTLFSKDEKNLKFRPISVILNY